MNGETEPIEQIVQVRDRPVGVQRSRFGTSLVAVERGYFPVSHTGFHSLSGYGRNQPGPLAFSPGHLESLAENCDRNRRALLTAMRKAEKKEDDPRWRFIHVSLLVNKAVDEGFFAPEAERWPLWQAAHRLLTLVNNDPRFQPVMSLPAWTEETCHAQLEKMRVLHGRLKCFAQGDYSGELPFPLLGARAYARLPPKSVPEPIIALHELPIALTLNLNVRENQAPAAPRASPRLAAPAPVQPSKQLDLFGKESAAPTPRLSP